jgi:hypothetical protein
VAVEGSSTSVVGGGNTATGNMGIDGMGSGGGTEGTAMGGGVMEGMEGLVAGGVIVSVVAAVIGRGSGSSTWSMESSPTNDGPAGASSGSQACCWHCSLPEHQTEVSQ